MFQTYRPSGRIGPLAIPLLVLGVAVVLGLAFVYQLLLRWIPLIYINVLMTIGMGTAIGTLGRYLVRFGKVRNPALAILISLVLTGSAVSGKFWFQYRAFLNEVVSEVMLENQLPETERATVRKEVLSTVTFLAHIRFRVDQGWNVGRRNQAPMNGIVVYGVWVIELGILLYMGFNAPVAAAREPFSEPLHAWASEKEVVMTLPISDPEMIERIKSTSTVEALLEIPIPKTDEALEFAVYTVNSIPGQEMEDAYLSVDLMTFGVNRKGEEETRFKPLVKHAILSSQHREQLMENASLLKEAMDDYREAMAAEMEDEADEFDDEESADRAP